MLLNERFLGPHKTHIWTEVFLRNRMLISGEYPIQTSGYLDMKKYRRPSLVERLCNSASATQFIMSSLRTA
jgi:hypothetical protein